MTFWAPPSGGVDYTTWYTLWTIGVALNGICVRGGVGGSQTEAGDRHTLTVFMSVHWA